MNQSVGVVVPVQGLGVMEHFGLTVLELLERFLVELLDIAPGLVVLDLDNETHPKRSKCNSVVVWDFLVRLLARGFLRLLFDKFPGIKNEN